MVLVRRGQLVDLERSNGARVPAKVLIPVKGWRLGVMVEIEATAGIGGHVVVVPRRRLHRR